MSGAPLPVLSECAPLVRATWLDVARAVEKELGRSMLLEASPGEVVENLREMLRPDATAEHGAHGLLTLARVKLAKLLDLEATLNVDAHPGEQSADTLGRIREALAQAEENLARVTKSSEPERSA